MSMELLTGHENSAIDKLSIDDKVRWLLRFLQCDVSEYSPTQLIALGDDLYHAMTRVIVTDCPGTPLFARDVLELHQELRIGMQQFMSSVTDIWMCGRVDPPGMSSPPIASTVARLRMPHGVVRAIRCRVNSPDPRTAILYEVGELLCKVNDRLQACQACGMAFVRRYRQEFCSEACGQKTRNQRKAKKKLLNPSMPLAPVSAE